MSDLDPDDDLGEHAAGPPPRVSWRDFLDTFDTGLSTKFVAVFAVWFAAAITMLELANSNVMVAFCFAVVSTQLLLME